ncbi:hypothetical protein H5410_005982 [Solanum commersonii]|uniref:Uncharacterized protein n=1 Tax=Solanum commersonii TaxID=4109 RepID=A0A9J6A8Y8_SOLCO|nr:hypothetical protein H5410_005982 [Solanum commersonii]
MSNQEADLSMKRAFAAMGNSSEEESEDGGFENQSLLAIEQTNKYDFLALIIETDSEDEEEDDKQSKALTERNRLLQENLDHTKLDLERNLRWTRSSEMLTQIQERQTTCQSGIGFRKQNNLVAHTIHMSKTLCTHCGNSGNIANEPGSHVTIIDAPVAGVTGLTYGLGDRGNNRAIRTLRVWYILRRNFVV